MREYSKNKGCTHTTSAMPAMLDMPYVPESPVPFLVKVMEIMRSRVLLGFRRSLSLHVSPIPWLLMLQLPTRLTFRPSTPFVEGSRVSVMDDDASSGLFGILRDRLNEAATQPPLTVQFP